MPFFPRQEEGEGRIRWFTDEEEERLLAMAVRMDYPSVAEAAAVFIDTGMRMGELWACTPRQIDFDLGLLMLHPARPRPAVPLPPDH
jgi:integrase